MLVTGDLNADATYGKIDIRGGSGGYAVNSGGSGSIGRAYIFAGTSNLSLAVNFPDTPSTALMDTGNLVTKTIDSSPPSGAFFIYSKKSPGSSTATVVNQSTFSNIRYGDIVNFRHYLNEYPYSYTEKIYVNGVLQTPVSNSFVTDPATVWETTGMVMNWGEITINKFGRYSLTFNASDYWGIGGDDPEGPFEGSVIPLAIPISF